MSKTKTSVISRDESTYIKDLHFTKCRACGSKDLMKFDVDTLCMDCDWNSVLMDVDCGNFEKRIAIMNRKRNDHQEGEVDLIPSPESLIEDLYQDIVA